MASLRTILNFVVAGAMLGVFAATLILSRFIVWNNTAATAALCNCEDTSRQAVDRLVNGQMTGCAAGAGLGLVAGVVFLSMRRKKAQAAPPAKAVPPPPAK